MNERVNGILYKIAEEIFEKLAFIFSFPEDDRGDIDPASAVTAGVAFTGPFSGRLVVVITRDILAELTGNMLGVDDADETAPEQQEDALKELVNVICGNLLPDIGGSETVFNVNPPEIIPQAEAITQAAEPAGLARLDLEEGKCDICLFVEGALPDDL